MKKVGLICFTALVSLSLAGCGNSSKQKENSSLRAENSSLKAKSSQNSSTKTISNKQSDNNSQTNTEASSSSTSQLTTDEVANRFTQVHRVESGSTVYATATSTPGVYHIYVKGPNQDPNVDSIADHYMFNVNSNTVTHAVTREQGLE
ncbi:hypothetical protein [Limosilactobacillus caecicola]|uniref:hypothetical protein n=1 Tax=Limosilactobacillus caecicola TaxID=2941332 RepID=UPI00203BB54B|nr:hypothetical protein [Limosilactobacillus caecicola]